MEVTGMAFDTFKDLKKGDKVRFEETFNPTGKLDKGKGEVKGFGRFGFKEFVWINGDDGRLHCIIYEDVRKQ